MHVLLIQQKSLYLNIQYLSCPDPNKTEDDKLKGQTNISVCHHISTEVIA